MELKLNFPYRWFMCTWTYFAERKQWRHRSCRKFDGQLTKLQIFFCLWPNSSWDRCSSSYYIGYNVFGWKCSQIVCSHVHWHFPDIFCRGSCHWVLVRRIFPEYLHGYWFRNPNWKFDFGFSVVGWSLVDGIFDGLALDLVLCLFSK